MRTQGMSEDINVRIAGQVTSEGLVIGWAFVHSHLLVCIVRASSDCDSSNRGGTRPYRPCGGNSAAGSEGLRTAHRGARLVEARGDFRGARSDTARPLLAAGNPRPNKARETERRGARARPRLPAVGGQVPRDAPRAAPRTGYVPRGNLGRLFIVGDGGGKNNRAGKMMPSSPRVSGPPAPALGDSGAAAAQQIARGPASSAAARLSAPTASV